MDEVATRVRPHRMNLISQEPHPQSEYRTISLTQGQVAIVDADDFERINAHKWYALWSPLAKSFYARRNIRNADGTRGFELMHREVLHVPPGDKRKVDHREPDQTLDNRKSNLRVATHAQNIQNSGVRANNSTGFKGVSPIQNRDGYASSIVANGKKKYLGYRSTASAAHDLYVDAAIELHGEFARTQ